MLNRDGVVKKDYGATRQILANVEFQYSMGCRVAQSLGTDVAGVGKIAKAGTPIYVNFANRQNEATAARGAISESATATVSGTGITAASVTAATFGTAVSNVDGTYEFSYDGTNWKFDGSTVNLGTYGISVTGSAASGDKINVAYVSAKAAVSANAVLLHDVNVTLGAKNGTALLFGFVNINRLDTDVQALVTAGVKVGDVQFVYG